MKKSGYRETFFSKSKEKIDNGQFTLRSCKGCHIRFMIGKFYSKYCDKCLKLPLKEREVIESKNKRKKRFIKFCSGGSMIHK